MKFKGSVMRSVLTAALAIGLLASCGGATQVEAFVPKRIIAFGDEYSVIDGAINGKKYSVNAIKYETDGTTPSVPTTYICASSPIWSQELAYAFGMVFNECRDATLPAQPNRIMAVASTGSEALAVQIKAFTDSDTFATNDLVTVWTGTNDIKNIYEDYRANGGIDPVAAAGAAGRLVGQGVVTITDLGAKVIVSTLPDLGYSPYAIAQNNLQAGSSQLLSDMTKNFNKEMRLKLEDVRNGGRSFGLVLADDLLRTLVLYPATYGFTNTTDAACVLAQGQDLRDCTPLTLAATATAANWMWADAIHLGPSPQIRIGDLAVVRARNNPF